MDRPKATERITIRLPEELRLDVEASASRRRVSVNEVILNAIENEFGRMLTYRLDYYADLRKLNAEALERHCLTNGEGR